MPTMYRRNPDTGVVETRYVDRLGIPGALLGGWSATRPVPVIVGREGPRYRPPSIPTIGAPDPMARGIASVEGEVVNPELPPPAGRPITVYRVATNGEVISAQTDKNSMAHAMSIGWSPYRPVEAPAFQFNEEGIPIGAYSRGGIEEAVGLYWINHLNATPGTIPIDARIVGVKKADAPSPSGAPRYNVTWEIAGLRPAYPEGMESFMDKGGGYSVGNFPPFANGWRGPNIPRSGARFTDEVVLYPDEYRPGAFKVIQSHLEPGMLLPPLSQQIIDGDISYEQVRENDARIGAIFDGMAKGTVSRGVGYWRLNQLVGREAAEILDDQAQLFTEALLQAQGVDITPGTLPRFSEERPQSLLVAAPDSPMVKIASEMASFPAPNPESYWNEFQVGTKYGALPIDPRTLPKPPTQGGYSDQWLYHQAEKAPTLTIDEIIAQAIAQAMSGFGGGGPVYQAPDRNQVRDSVKAMLVALVGRSGDARVEMLTDAYMNAHRAQFNGSPTDPGQAVKDKIRTFDDYRTIHNLRPEFVDEMDWLSYQNQGLVQGGMRNASVERRAITQAMVGTAPARAEQAGYLYEFEQTGRANMPGFFDKLKSTLDSLSQLVG